MPLRRIVRGYTLIEMVTVLVIAGIVATVAVPALMDRSALQARGFADSLRAMLRHGRNVATAQQRDVCVQVLTATLQARAVFACNAATPVSAPGESSPFVIDIPTGLNVSGTLTVRFNASGQPVPNTTQTITVGSQVLTVYRETGLIQ